MQESQVQLSSVSAWHPGYKQKIHGEAIVHLCVQAFVYECLDSGASSSIALIQVYDN